MTIYIDQDTLKRVNIHAPYKGFSRLDAPEIRATAGVIEIAEPAPPEDYSPDLYFRTEQEDAPYVIYTPKDPSVVAAAMIERKKEAIRSKEREVMDGYMKVSRQFMIQVLESLAAGQGITPPQLYAANKGYRAMVDLEARIVPIRAEIQTLEAQL